MDSRDEMAFVTALMNHILDGAKIPKMQIERAIAPILGMFIDRVLSQTLGETIVTLCPEFPLRKGSIDASKDNKSTNIDWLLYSETHKQLIFLELKTSDTSFDRRQSEIYRALCKKIAIEGAAFLLADIPKIMGASTEHGKYRQVAERIRHILPDAEQCFAGCHSARIIYLAPALARPENSELFWLSFSDLAAQIDPPYDAQWKIIHRSLTALDGSSRRSRNGLAEIGERKNFQQTESYQGIVKRCREDGDSIVVGFNGGIAALAAADLAGLQARSAYKWDFAERGRGSKQRKNWISGSEFLAQIDQLTRGA